MKRWFVDRSAQRGIPSVSLRGLLPEARFVGCRDLLASGCSADSRRIDPGQVFVAIRGPKHDGHAFVGRALERGAAAVVVERACDEAGLPQVVVDDAPAAHARICQALAGGPSRRLDVVGVVGGEGISAATVFLRAIFEADGRRAGCASRSGWTDGVRSYPAASSPADPQAMADMLAAMVDRDCRAAVLALPSEGLARGTAEGIGFASAVVMGWGAVGSDPEARVEARRRVARVVRRVVPGGVVVLDADDRLAGPLAGSNLDADLVTFGLENEADVSAVVEHRGLDGTRLVLKGFDREATVTLKPIAEEAVRAALAAAAAAWAQGVGIDAVVRGLESVDRLPGRLESIACRPGLAAFADRAETGADLAGAIQSLRDRGAVRVHCVLAAGVDPALAAGLAGAAEAHADRLVLAPGDRRPVEMAGADLEDLLRHVRAPGRVRVVGDRRAGLAAAVELARPGDAILLAGAGGPLRPPAFAEGGARSDPDRTMPRRLTA